VEAYVTSLLDREEHRRAVRRPGGFPLAIIQLSDFAAVGSIGRDQPDMRILHGGLEIRETAPGRLVHERLAVRRPLGTILGALGRSQPADSARANVQREDIVIEKLILVGLAI